MIDVLTPLTGRSDDTEAAYRDLVLEVVEAGEFNPTAEQRREVFNLLERTNRTAERFQFDVDTVTRRREATAYAGDAKKAREKAEALLKEWHETNAVMAGMPLIAEREAVGDKLVRLHSERFQALEEAKEATEWHGRSMRPTARRTDDGEIVANWYDWREFEVASDELWELQQQATAMHGGSVMRPVQLSRVG